MQAESRAMGYSSVITDILTDDFGVQVLQEVQGFIYTEHMKKLHRCEMHVTVAFLTQSVQIILWRKLILQARLVQSPLILRETKLQTFFETQHSMLIAVVRMKHLRKQLRILFFSI